MARKLRYITGSSGRAHVSRSMLIFLVCLLDAALLVHTLICTAPVSSCILGYVYVSLRLRKLMQGRLSGQMEERNQTLPNRVPMAHDLERFGNIDCTNQLF